MVSKWEGGAPSDAHEWLDALSAALGEDAGFYWVRFYRNPGGWRFELERRGETPGPDGSNYAPADESTALRVFTSLVDRGKPLDPSWSPSVTSAPAGVVPMPRRPPQPAHVAALRDQPRTAFQPPAPDKGTRTEPVPVLFGAPNPEPLPLSASLPPLTVLQRPETALEAFPPEEARTEPVPVVLDASSPAPLPRSASVLPLSIVERPETALQVASVDRARRAEPVLVAQPGPNTEPLPRWVPARPATRRLPDWRALTRRVPDWRALTRRLPDWRALTRRLPDWRTLTRGVLDWRTLTRGLPHWRSLRPVLVYAPAVLLVAFAWWLSRGRLSSSPASPPPPSPAAAPSQAPQTAPGRLSGQEPGQAARHGAEIRPGTPRVRRGELVDLNDPGVRPPVLVSRARPLSYPPLALARGLSGTVRLSALVDEAGRVVEIALVRTSEAGVGFEDAAMTYVHSHVYRPATKRGVPVRVRLPIEVDFQAPAR